jgi:hypothetical protein
MNGIESETTKVIKEVKKLAEKPAAAPTEDETADLAVKEESEDESGNSSSGAAAADEGTPARSTRSRTKSGKKGKKI